MARSLWTVLVWLVVLVGCGDNLHGSGDLALSATTISLAAGDSTEITLTGASGAVAWSTGDSSIATVVGRTGGATVTAVSAGATTITATVGGESISVPITVGDPRLVSIAITPPTTRVARNMVAQLSAVGTYGDHTMKNITADATWSSSDDPIASVDGNGAVTGGDPGMATITATIGAISATATITVTSATLVSIAITPPNPMLPLGVTQQLHATGTYSDATMLDLTGSVSWSSATTTTATISASGLVTTKATGTSTITGQLGSTVGSTTLTVTGAQLVSIAVTPANLTLPIGLTQQYLATGTFTDLSTADVTSMATWTASGTHATIDANGLATTASAGDSTIKAEIGTIDGTTTLTVSTTTIASIAVDPPSPTVNLTSTQQFAATATLSDNTTVTITNNVMWSVDAHATISNAAGSKGLATPTEVGTAKVTATLGAASGFTTMTIVSRTLQSIEVSPVAESVPGNWVVQFTATGTYDDNTTDNLTSSVVWDSDMHGVVTVSNGTPDKGLASTTAVPGTATISATLGAVSGTTTLTVTAKHLTSITIDPPAPDVLAGGTQQFTATGVFDDATTQPMTDLVTWSSGTLAVATISNAAGSHGLATAVAVGTSTITATFGTTTATAPMNVVAKVLTSIAVTPTTATTAVGFTTQFTAMGTYSDSSTANLTNDVTWSAGTEAIATISNAVGTKGLATGASTGSTTITAKLGATTSNDATLTVSTLQSLVVAPAAPSVPNGRTQQFTATGTFADGSMADITTSVTWASATTTVAQISNADGSKGLATVIAGSGTSLISATATGGLTDATVLTATAAALDTITLSASAITLSRGGTQNIVATGHFSDGSTANVTSAATTTWTSTDATIASVSTASPKGIVTAIAVGGPVTITAAVGTVTATLTATVVTLAIVNVGPADGIVGVKRTSPIQIQFGHAVDLTTVTVQAADGACDAAKSLQVSADNFVTCIGLGAPTQTGAIVYSTPVAQLAADTTYKIKVTQTVANSSSPTDTLTTPFTQTTGWVTSEPAVCTAPIVISQVYGAGGNGGATYNADFVELHNRGSEAESIGGMALEYASVAGTSWNNVVLLPNVTVPAGGYYLVGMTPGATGAALPTPDFTGTIAMAAGSGKIALTNASVQLPSVACPIEYTIDFVGFGGSAATTLNCTEGGTTPATAAPAPSTTASDVRKDNGCTDTDTNSADFTTATGAAFIPRNSATPPVLCTTTCDL